MRYPRDFTPDLRRLKSWPSMRESLWRQPYLIDLTYAENFGLVKRSIPGRRPLKILEVGCGTGFMSLELARIGHDVLAIDSNKEIFRIARRTAESDPYKRSRGNLRFESLSFDKWTDNYGSYDIILFSRVLHDMPRPEKTLSKTRSLLKRGGRIVCLEYAYDRLDSKTASWLYFIQKTLEVEGHYPPQHLSEDPKTGIDQVLKRSTSGKQHINTFKQMRQPLEHLFHKTHFSWHCYHCWEILRLMKIAETKKEQAFAGLLKKTEQLLIGSNQIQAALFNFVGTKTSG